MIPLIHPSTVSEKVSLLIVIFVISPIVSFAVSNIVFPENPSIPFIFFTVIQIIPYIFYFFEERTTKLVKFFESMDPGSVQRTVNRITYILILYFFVNFLMQLLLFLILPEEIVRNVFKYPMKIISSIKGGYFEGEVFEILSNNFVVLLTTFFISLIYLTGSTFVVSWNSSILAYLVGSIIKERGDPLQILGYLLHGIPEITSYVMVGISGAILSMAFSKNRTSPFLTEFLKISLLLFLFSVLLLLFSFGIEIGISPIFLRG